MGSVEENFDKAIKIISDGKSKNSGSASNEEKLKLYGWFKQAKEGDISISKPWAVQIEACLKWNAWHERKGKSTEEAMQGYVVEAKEQIRKHEIHLEGVTLA